VFRPLGILERLVKRKIFGNRSKPTSKVENSVMPVEVKTILPTSTKCESITDVSDKKSAEKICPTCGITFTATNNRQKFCSKECYQKDFNVKRGIDADHSERTCPTCGKSFETRDTRKIYCSRQCKIKAFNARHQKKSTPVEKTCPICGESFIAKSRRQKYCSERCRQKAAGIRYSAFRVKKTPPTFEKTCPTCGKSFETRDTRKIYCSRQCRDLANNKRPRDRKPVEKFCPVCGKSFIARNVRQIYCSPWCGGERIAKVPGHIKTKPVKKKPEKSLEQWMQEARDCGMSYGKYRAAVERLGKTYDELKIKR